MIHERYRYIPSCAVTGCQKDRPNTTHLPIVRRGTNGEENGGGETGSGRKADKGDCEGQHLFEGEGLDAYADHMEWNYQKHPSCQTLLPEKPMRHCKGSSECRVATLLRSDQRVILRRCVRLRRVHKVLRPAKTNRSAGRFESRHSRTGTVPAASANPLHPLAKRLVTARMYAVCRARFAFSARSFAQSDRPIKLGRITGQIGSEDSFERAGRPLYEADNVSAQ